MILACMLYSLVTRFPPLHLELCAPQSLPVSDIPQGGEGSQCPELAGQEGPQLGGCTPQEADPPPGSQQGAEGGRSENEAGGEWAVLSTCEK